MVKPHNGFRLWKDMNDVAWVSLVTGVCILLAALIGALINPLVGNWIQSAGMAIVGMFYLALFASNLPPRGISAIGAAELQDPHGNAADSKPASIPLEEDAVSR